MAEPTSWSPHQRQRAGVALQSLQPEQMVGQTLWNPQQRQMAGEAHQSPQQKQKQGQQTQGKQVQRTLAETKLAGAVQGICSPQAMTAK